MAREPARARCANHPQPTTIDHEAPPMTRSPRSLLPALAILAALAATAACTERREGPGERAGRGLDRAGERLRDTVDPPRGPAERFGRSVDRTVR
jgi:hypothetical protein